MTTVKALAGIVLDEQTQLSIGELSVACASSSEWIVELVHEGVLEPVDSSGAEWRFPGDSLPRARAAMRLQRDLGINLAGIALVLDMLDEIGTLRALLSRYEPPADS